MQSETERLLPKLNEMRAWVALSTAINARSRRAQKKQTAFHSWPSWPSRAGWGWQIILWWQRGTIADQKQKIAISGNRRLRYRRKLGYSPSPQQARSARENRT